MAGGAIPANDIPEKGINRVGETIQDKLFEQVSYIREILEKNGIKVAKGKGLESGLIPEKSTASKEKETDKKFESMFKGIEKGLSKHTDSLKKETYKNIAGPLRLVLDPMQKFFKVDLMEKMSGGLKKVFPKTKEKSSPSKSDIAKHEAGQAAIWKHNEEQKDKDKSKEKDKLGTFINSLLGRGLIGTGAGVGAKILGGLAKVLPIAAIVGGIIWMVFDGVKASLLSKKWGVGNISAFIGGFLGGSGSGLKNAFANMGKWALVGAGAGFLVGGPIGMIAGGLIGGAVGGLLGFIGGKNIAKAFESIGKFFSNLIKGVTKVFDENPVLKSIAKTGMSFFKIFTPLGMIFEVFGNIGADLDKILKGKGSIGQKVTKILLSIPFRLAEGLLRFVTAIPRFLMEVFDIGKGLTKDKDKISKDILVQFVGKAINFIGSLFSPDNLKKAGNFMGTVFQGLFDFFKGLWNQLGFLVSDIVANPVSFLKGGKEWESFRGTRVEKNKKPLLDANKKDYEEKLKLLDSKYSNKKSEQYITERRQLESGFTKEKTRIEGLAEGGIAGKGVYRFNEKEPEIVMPVSKVQKGFDNATMDSLFKTIKDKEKNNNYGQEIVAAINTLTEIMKKKDFNNIINNISSNDFSFDKLRQSMAYGDI